MLKIITSILRTYLLCKGLQQVLVLFLIHETHNSSRFWNSLNEVSLGAKNWERN